MKKYLALLLAIVLTLSFFTFTVSAADAGATPYATTCPECGNVMRTVRHTFYGWHFKVQSCPNFDGMHLHNEVYAQPYWVCKTVGCLEYNVEILAGDPVYVGEECGHSG